MIKPDPAAAFTAQIAAAQAHVDARHWIEAVAALERAVILQPEAGGAWRALGDAKLAAGDATGASTAHDRAARLSLAQAPLADAVAAISANKLATAEQIVRTRLQRVPTDIAAIVLLADLALRAGNIVDAVRFLRRALELAPDYVPARSEFDRLLVINPKHIGYRNMRAATLDLLGDHAGAAAAYHELLADDSTQPLVWMTLGNVFKTIGDIPAAIVAFRKSLTVASDTGESWWGLANLKSFRFDEAYIAAMQAELTSPALTDANRICIDFALGKALEDKARYAESFARYEAGNGLQRVRSAHDPEYLTLLSRRCEILFTPDFFSTRAGSGDHAPDPIFIVGMPRSGSTLVEQMLASHPAIEGTMELPEMPRIARLLGGLGNDPATAPYPDNLARLSGAQIAELGADYLRRAARWRKTDCPFFIDKLPMNFVSVGLIRLILPNAKIIDVRRHLLGCGLSVFRQYFPNGRSFSTTTTNIGRFYTDYVRMMQLWNDRLPGFVLRVIYEDLIADADTEVRRMLEVIGLPFDPACLAFRTSKRAVRTPSVEQVRRPLYSEAVDHWRHHASWLGPMKDALGDVLAKYPAVP
jgi:tetratricopeptide (TPR) repeat protein